MKKETLSFEVKPDGSKVVGDLYSASKSRDLVILLHGGGQTRHAWGQTARILAQNGLAALSLDLKGHGDSYWDPAREYGPDSMADDVIKVMKSPLFQGKNVILVGASMGGLTSLVAQAKEPLAQAVVLVDITPRMEDVGVERVLGFMEKHMVSGFSSLEEAAESIRQYTPGRKRETNYETLQKNLRKREDGRFYWHWDAAFIDHRREEMTPEERNRRKDLHEAFLWQCAEAIRVPLLLIRGKSSDLISEETGRYFVERIKGASYLDVSDAAHMVAGDSNEAFTNALLSFLSQQGFPKRLPSTSKL